MVKVEPHNKQVIKKIKAVAELFNINYIKKKLKK
jgi:hypothetical protein